MATRPAKTYDAVAEVRKVRDELGEAMADMTAEEQMEFLRQKLEQARRTRAERRRQRR
jgi:hypothetical protein